MAEQVTPIMMGAGVPEWLLVAEPMAPGAQRGHFRFAVDVHVVETPDYFVVVPMQLGHVPVIIDASGMADHRIYAPTKPTHVVSTQQVFFPLEVNAWHGGVLEPPELLPPNVIPPAPPPPYWRRVWRAIQGR